MKKRPEQCVTSAPKYTQKGFGLYNIRGFDISIILKLSLSNFINENLIMSPELAV